jgi:hypothetical protein
MLGNFNTEWSNLNSQRRYPLTEDSSGTDRSNSFNIPEDFLVGLDIPVSSSLLIDVSRFFIRRIVVAGNGFSVTVAYEPALGEYTDVAVAAVPRVGFTNYSSYQLVGIGDFVETLGKLTIGRLDGIDAQPAGLFTFDLPSARIEPDCIRPSLQGVMGVIVVNGTQQSPSLHGDIEFVAGENIQITSTTEDGGARIQISAISGAGLATTCDCVDLSTSPPIRRINGIVPTAAGDFFLLGSNCIEIQPITNGLRIVDKCAEPCCGCTELEEITRVVSTFASKASTLDNAITRLEASVTEFDRSVLGSKLNDNGCGSTL